MKRPTQRGLIAAPILAALVVVSVMVATSAVGAGPEATTQSQLFHGPIKKVYSNSQAFRMEDLLARGGKGAAKTIKTTAATRYSHLSGFGALHKGLSVDVTVREGAGLTAEKVKKAPPSPIRSG